MEIIKNETIYVDKLEKVSKSKIIFQEIQNFIQQDILNNKVMTTFNEVVDIQGFELYQFSPNIYGYRICFNNNSDNIGKLWYNIKKY